MIYRLLTSWLLLASVASAGEKLNPPPQVVRVRCMDKDGTPSYGTGALLGPGLVVTNHHVVRARKSDTSIKIIFPDWTVLDGRVVKTDHKPDLAAIKLEHNVDVVPLQIGPNPKIGDTVKFFGYGSGLPSWAEGKIIKRWETTRWERMQRHVKESDQGPAVEVAAPVKDGDSGSPLLDSEGRFVGTVFGGSDGTTLGTDVDTVLKFLGWKREKVRLY